MNKTADQIPRGNGRCSHVRLPAHSGTNPTSTASSSTKPDGPIWRHFSSICDSSWRWARLSERDVLCLLQADADNRFQCHEGRIRALYGHSVGGVCVAVQQSPPLGLYHATSTDLLPRILSDGLRPMARRHVHLTSDRSYATRIGARYVQWALLGVNVREAVAGGLRFCRANRHVWQTAFVDPSLLYVLEQHETPLRGQADDAVADHRHGTVRPDCGQMNR